MLTTIGGISTVAGFVLQVVVHWLRPAGGKGKGESKDGKMSKGEGVIASLASFRKAG